MSWLPPLKREVTLMCLDKIAYNQINIQIDYGFQVLSSNVLSLWLNASYIVAGE